jgi:hypothetical protein
MQTALSIQQILAQPENTRLVVQLLESEGVINRSDLTRELCEQLDLRDPKGKLRLGTTHKALRVLEAKGLWKLPTAERLGSGQWQPKRLAKPVVAPRAMPAQVEDVQGLGLVEVTTEEEKRTWNELILGEHPLHNCRLVGRQLRYLVQSNHGCLGAVGFGSSALYLKPRDEWIAWNTAQRMEHLPRVINMTRFLIRPKVNCENLASKVLSICVRQVPDDFERRYGVRPWLMESFVDRSFYDGCSYKAANWRLVGQTKGLGRNGEGKVCKSIKDIYLYPLVDHLDKRIGVERQPLIALDVDSGLDAAGWAGQEFGDCQLGDPRRTQRLIKIISDKAAQPGGSYSQAAGGNRHTLKAYYRLINNKHKKLTPQTMLQTHRSQTIRRMKTESTVLIVQDTSQLNYSTRPKCKGLGEIGSNQTKTKSQGLDLHSCLAIGGETGLPLGVLHLNGYAPESAEDKDPKRPIEEKESFRWLEAYDDAATIAAQITETRVVSVTDREGDMFELFDRRRGDQGQKAHLLVRAKWDRVLENSDLKLFEELAAAPLAERFSLPVPRQRERAATSKKAARPNSPARTAEVEIRFKEVTLSPPQTSELRSKQPLKLWAIYLVEPHPPAGATPLRWLLLTTIPVTSAKVARQCVQYYCLRWRIEDWHRVLKSGCKVLEHQNHTAEVLLRAIALDAVIAWRIMLLVLLGREVPELPSQLMFDPAETQTLELLAQKKSLSVGEAIIQIAKLGGYLNRKSDGHPGYECMWKGMLLFYNMVRGIQLYKLSQSG